MAAVIYLEEFDLKFDTTVAFITIFRRYKGVLLWYIGLQNDESRKTEIASNLNLSYTL